MSEHCDYCHGVGACPKCWGRAAINEKDEEIGRLRAELDDLRGRASRNASRDASQEGAA